ncbi:hypothetical protein EIP91_004757 [Steccherinum ochraceum]|uniref:Uncharacterized protein n=1 Tax=Steccherinum ochraceum TaxID=92696 RepID=A0A4V2MVY1_9APHY|nr:hypothetical protein EIP91_004757 [Steccherinum ochraceum]
MSSEPSEKDKLAAEIAARNVPTSDVNVLKERLKRDPRFNPPAPSLWKRVALLITIVALFYIALKMRIGLLQQPEPPVVHAQRYSKEYKFRPAASPIVTERLKDGRVRVRGAHPVAQ